MRAPACAVRFTPESGRELPYTGAMSIAEDEKYKERKQKSADADANNTKPPSRAARLKREQGEEQRQAAAQSNPAESPEAEQRRAKLLALRRSLENGTYRVEPDKVAAAMLYHVRVEPDSE